MFFDNQHFFRYREAVQRRGIDVAIVPGIFLFLYLLIPPLLLFVPVVYLSSIADTLARGVHDKAANTIVLLSPRPSPA